MIDFVKRSSLLGDNNFGGDYQFKKISFRFSNINIIFRRNLHAARKTAIIILCFGKKKKEKSAY